MKILLVIVALAGIAFADPNPQAAAHYKQGKAFLDSKQYDRAIEEFMAAYAIDKVASHLFNIGRAYDALADYDHAVEYYQRYLDAEPGTPRAAEVRGLIAVATQAKKDAAAKKLADEAAAAKERAKVLAASHLKQAEAFAQTSAWADAGNEYREAFAIDADPAHLIAAGDAYRKGDALDKAREAYAAYIDKVPQGGESDRVRAKLAEVTTALEKAIAEKERLLKEKEEHDRLEKERLDREAGKGPPKIEYDTTARDARRAIVLRLTIPGGIVTLGGLVVGTLALKEKSKANSDCDNANVCGDDGLRHFDNAKKFSRVADVLLGVGIAATATGLILWANAPRAIEKKPQLVPTASPTGAGVSLIGRF